MDHLKAKIDAGADYICTQLFFNNHDFYDFRDRCELAGIKVPIVAGIMPVTSVQRSCGGWPISALGARFPAPVCCARINRTGAGRAGGRPNASASTGRAEQCSRPAGP